MLVSWGKIRSFLMIGGTLIVVLSAGAAASCAAYQDVVLDNRDHGVACEQLPTAEELTQVLEQHQAVVEQILDVNPGQVFVDIDRDSCPGHADVVISMHRIMIEFASRR
jgi:hypothetical protein